MGWPRDSQGLFYEDLTVGLEISTGGRTITEVDIVLYNNMMWVHNALHSDREHMKDATFSGVVAPAPFTLGVVLGLLNSTGYLEGSALAALGYDRVRFLAPVRPQDTLYASAVVSSRRETSDPRRGVVVFRMTAKNQAGTVVFEGDRTVLVQRRHPDSSASASP